MTSAYSEGGGLYALGIIHANHGEKILPYLRKALRDAQNNEVVQHGACLALGMAGMASGDQEVYDQLKVRNIHPAHCVREGDDYLAVSRKALKCGFPLFFFLVCHFGLISYVLSGNLVSGQCCDGRGGGNCNG